MVYNGGTMRETKANIPTAQNLVEIGADATVCSRGYAQDGELDPALTMGLVSAVYISASGIVAALDRLTEAVGRLDSRCEPVDREDTPHLRKADETRDEYLDRLAELGYIQPDWRS